MSRQIMLRTEKEDKNNDPSHYGFFNSNREELLLLYSSKEIL